MQKAELAVDSAKPKFANFAAVANTTLTPERLKKFRAGRQLSQQQFAALFRWSRIQKPYTRNYISMLECGKVPITPEFEKNFYRVRDALREQPTPSKKVAQETEIIADFPMPRRLHIIPTPRRCERRKCAVCLQNRTKWFVPITPNQRRHNSANCKRAARRKGKRK